MRVGCEASSEADQAAGPAPASVPLRLVRCGFSVRWRRWLFCRLPAASEAADTAAACRRPPAVWQGEQ